MPEEPHEISVDGDDWRQNRKLVRAELDRANRGIERLGDKLGEVDTKIGSELTQMKVEIATIKAKVIIYGGIAAILLSAVVNYLMRKL